MKWDEQHQQQIASLVKELGVPGVRFAEWAAVTLWASVRNAALAAGLTPDQADNVAANTCQGTFTAFRTSVRLHRQLKIGGRS